MGAGGLLAFGQSPEARRHFASGNQHYQQTQYQQAIESYQAVLSTGLASGALYYNLGNAYFRTGELGHAILYYEKARRWLPDTPELRHSLDVARSSAALPAPPPSPAWHALTASVDPSTTLFLGLGLYLIGVCLLGYRLWQEQDAIFAPRAVLPLAVGLLLAILALGTSWLRTLDRRGVVVAEQAPLYHRPVDDIARDTTLQEGSVLLLQRRQPGWTEVRLADGQTGWLRTDMLEDV
jgi:tetratricopeptide (TPR) repeat protein